MSATKTKMEQQRARFYPAGTPKISIKKTDIRLYLWQDDDNGFFAVAGFYGRGQKPRLYTKTKTNEQRDKSIKSFIEQRRDELERKAKFNRPHSLVVGDILVSSWGYEQTNVDFYQVIKIAGQHMVVVREIKQQKKYGEKLNDRGTSTPCPDAFKGAPIRRKANGDNYISISSHQLARKWDGRPMGWSSYH